MAEHTDGTNGWNHTDDGLQRPRRRARPDYWETERRNKIRSAALVGLITVLPLSVAADLA